MDDNKDERIEYLEWNNALLMDIIDNIHEGVMAVNEREEIILISRVIEQGEGVRREDILGKREREVYSSIPDYNFDAFEKRVMKSKKPIIDETYTYIAPNGHVIHLIMSVFPFFYNGKLSAVYSIGRDTKLIEQFISKTLEIQNKYLSAEAQRDNSKGAKYFLDDIIGSSEEMVEVLTLSKKVATHSAPILIIGETGTGKELIAQGIHNASAFNRGPFVAVNCAAIPDTLMEGMLFGTVKGAFTGAIDMLGIFEQAENGTVFLDEINSLPIQLQPKLLRVLQEKVLRRVGGDKEIPINCRIISAANQDPFEVGIEGMIRPDLLYRLATVTLNVPPLRERGKDVLILALHFINLFNKEYRLNINQISEEVLDILQDYSWAGNVRELSNLIESAYNMVEKEDRILTMGHISPFYKQRLVALKSEITEKRVHKGSLKQIMVELEKQVIENELRNNNWNVSKTALKFNLLRQNLQQKMRKLKILRPKI